ncbi:MAG: cbb3-type cytochrome oxidase assembly protein CcoS [Bdellovibrionales bacterium]
MGGASYAGKFVNRHSSFSLSDEKESLVEIIFFMIPVSLFLGLGFLAAFLWANKTGQFDDLSGPSHRIIFEDEILNSGSSDEKTK